MYSKCVKCPKLGVTCGGPTYVSMPPQILINWCKERKKHLGLTNEKLSELSGVPKGTVDSLLANSHADFKVGTIQQILRVLIGGKWMDDPCADGDGSVDAEQKEKIRQLEAEIRHRDETIQQYKDQVESMKTLITNTNARYSKQIEDLQDTIKTNNARHAESLDFVQDQVKNRNTAVKILAIATALGWGLIIVALVIDKLNPHLGFFWRDFASWINSGNVFKGIV